MACIGKWAVLLLLLLQAPGFLQQCSSSDVRSKGAKGDGVQDDTPSFQAVQADGTAGVVYMPGPGTYKIAQTLTISKPVVAAAGASFLVPAGVTLALDSQPQHPQNDVLFKGRTWIKAEPLLKVMASRTAAARDSTAVAWHPTVRACFKGSNLLCSPQCCARHLPAVYRHNVAAQSWVWRGRARGCAKRLLRLSWGHLAAGTDWTAPCLQVLEKSS